jgi:hypothetical protein
MNETHTISTTQPVVDPIVGPAPDTASSADADDAAAVDPVVIGPIRRRTVDTIAIAAGAVLTVVLLAAGSLLTWGSRFANDYVGRELSSQHISFPDTAALSGEGRTDLLSYAGHDVNTGSEAQAYASFIAGHLEGVANGATYADLAQPERAATAAVQTAVDNRSPQATVDELQAKADQISGERNTLFKGETLRGLLLSTYAWSTIGRIAGIAAIVSFVAAGLMAALVVLGAIHRRRLAA